MNTQNASLFKKSLFVAGLILAVVSLFDNPYFRVSQNTLILFGFLLLIAFFDDLQEFDFFGLRGRKVEKKLEQLHETIKDGDKVATTIPDDQWNRLRTTNLAFAGVDPTNFLALVFECERLLRGIGQVLFSHDIHDTTPAEELGELLHENDYLTEHGALQWNILLEVRNIVISGQLSPNDEKLVPWIAVADRFYQEIVDDIRTVSDGTQ